MNSRVSPPPFSLDSFPTATFEVTYIGFPADAQLAFQRAVDIWESLIVSPATIRVTARWESLSAGVLGSASATSVWRDFPGTPLSNTWYPVALAEKLAGGNLNSTDSSDINASFNSDLGNWYLGTSGNPPGGQYDFVSVVLHELGHGLGFFGSMIVTGQEGEWGIESGFPFIFDTFAENGSNQKLTNTSIFPNPSIALGDQLTGNNVFFDGPNASSENGGSPPKLFCPSSWETGSSFSHLDEAAFPAGNPNSLMTPVIGTAEVIHSPGNIALGMFEDWGWTTSVLPPPPSVKWEETFASLTIPSGWITIDNDGSGSGFSYEQNLEFNQGQDVVNPQAGSSFWFSNFGNANGAGLIDEWLISPRVDGITSGDVLCFWAGAIGGQFDDSLRVFVSTTDNAVGSFTSQIGYFRVEGPVGAWHEYCFDLSAFSGEDIYIAVNYYIVDGGITGNHSDNVWVDHFLVTSELATTTILQNPALSRYADIVVVNSDFLLNPPIVDVWIGVDTTRIPMSLISGADKTFAGPYEFSQSGTYTIATSLTDPGFEITLFRTFGVVLARAGLPATLVSTDGKASLQIMSLREDVYFLSDTYESEGERVYQFGPAREFPEPLVLEISYDPSDYPDPGQPAISRKSGSEWIIEPTLLFPEENKLRIYTNRLGLFKLGSDPRNEVNTPVSHSLSQNYPNPFNPSTTIRFELPEDGPVMIAIHNILGRRVRTLHDGFHLAGNHEVRWDGTDDNGNSVASGVYVYRLQAGNFGTARKLMLLR